MENSIIPSGHKTITKSKYISYPTFPGHLTKKKKMKSKNASISHRDRVAKSHTESYVNNFYHQDQFKYKIIFQHYVINTYEIYKSIYKCKTDLPGFLILFQLLTVIQNR